MPIIQGVSSVFGALTDESGYKKVSNYDKGQRQMHKQRGDLLQQGGGYQDAMRQLMQYLDPNSQAYSDFEAPYRTRFNEQTLPGIAEQFAGGAHGGALSSSGFGQALGSASAGFEADLIGMKEQMRRASIQDILGQYQQHMDAKPFSYQEQGPGVASSIFTKLGGLSNPYGAPNLGGGSSSTQRTAPQSAYTRGYDTQFRQQGLPPGAY